MKLVDLVPGSQCRPILPEDMNEEISPEERKLFQKVVSVDLADWQKKQVLTPGAVYKRQEKVLGVHWHPEFVPMDLIMRRVEAMFPNKREELLIPTQHNVLMDLNGYSGVEVDCYASGFNQKVQLLLHFESARVREASVLESMLAHTFKYRSSQLFEFMHALTKPVEEHLSKAVRELGADEHLVRFVQTYVKKIETLLDQEWDQVPKDSIKNKLLRNYFDGLRPIYGDNNINRAQALLKAVKKSVKAGFSLSFFYRATEVIEETRALGGCVLIPHPEEFWPILLARYDVDGFEVWNPQSRRYTNFLIDVVYEHNKRDQGRDLLVFMGDDTHMGEKTKDPALQDTAKASREIGLQPAWDDLRIRKKLIVSGFSRESVIKEYKARLAG